MWKRLLTNLNGLIIILIGLFLISIQTTILNIPSSGELQPEFLLLMVIYLGLNRNSIEGSILSFILGHIVEIHSATPPGAAPLAAILVFMITRILVQTIFIPSLMSSIALVMGLTLIWRTTIGLCNWWINDQVDWIPHSIAFVFPAMLLHGILNIPIFEFLKSTDSLTGKGLHKNQQSEIQMDT